MTCARCHRLEDENRELRRLVHALWEDLKMRYRLASGRFDREPVPPLMMASGDVFEIEKEAA